MSKKDRLKAQKAKQDLVNKEIEEQEALEKEETKEKQSKSARKMRHKARRFRPNGEPIYFLILKILMIVPFGYSGFFYGGVLIVGIFGGYIDETPPKWVAVCAFCGVLAMAVGIFISFFKKYIVSFVLNLGGTIAFLRAGQYMIEKIQYKLENYSVDESLQAMDKDYMRYYYPIIAVAVISLALLVCAIIRKILEKKRIQHEKDTAPVKSILEMSSDE